jgi:hypothetical protein
MTNLIAPRFTIANVARATGVSADTIRQWYKREVLTIGMTDLPAADVGLARLFSGRTALAIGIMGELIKLRIPPDIAARAAIKFAHTGDGEREPGHLFPNGETLLVVTLDHQRIVNVDPKTALRAIISPSKPTVVLLLDELIDTFRGGLGLDRDPLPKPMKRQRAKA